PDVHQPASGAGRRDKPAGPREIRGTPFPVNTGGAGVRAVAPKSGESRWKRLARRGRHGRSPVHSGDLRSVDREIQRPADGEVVERGPVRVERDEVLDERGSRMNLTRMGDYEPA